MMEGCVALPYHMRPGQYHAAYVRSFELQCGIQAPVRQGVATCRLPGCTMRAGGGGGGGGLLGPINISPRK